MSMNKIFESEQVSVINRPKKHQGFKIYSRYQFFKFFKKNISYVIDLIMNEFGSEEPIPERIISFLELIIRQVQYYKSSPTKLTIYINEHSDEINQIMSKEINQIMSKENNYRIIIDEQLLVQSTGSAEKCWSIEKV